MAIPIALLSKIGSLGGGKGGGQSSTGSLGQALGRGTNAPANVTKSTLGVATGILQQIQAAKLKKKAESAMPSLIDPRQASFLAELNQKRKSIDTGADFAAGMNAIDQTNAGTNNAIVNASGGDAGGTLQGLLQSQAVANQGKNNVLAEGQNQQMQYNSMFNDLNNKIAGRALQLQMYRSQQARGEWAQKQQNASQNLQAGMAGITSSLLAPTSQNSTAAPVATSAPSAMAGITPTASANPTSMSGAVPSTTQVASGSAPTLDRGPGASDLPKQAKPNVGALMASIGR